MKKTKLSPSTNVLGVDVNAIDMEAALTLIASFLAGPDQHGSNQSSSHDDRPNKGYICVAGVHGLVTAQHSPQLAEAYANSAMTIPDGMPLVWVGRLQGHPSMRRVTGPDIMLEMFRSERFAGLTHFFYGGEQGVAGLLRDRLLARFPSARIVGTYTPPFRDLSSEEEAELIETVRALKPDILWVGISCPRQELFMARYQERLDARLMFGVGAAFDFHTGRIRDSAPWVKAAGLQWLHRLMQDPRRLWRRYLTTNPAFLWKIMLQLTGLRQYAPAPMASRSVRPAANAISPSRKVFAGQQGPSGP
ncbi:MAG TPA: WecB/TagA/CpsF family glycosyltransferase [Acidisarcina sp.]